jgi:hypothetical protein
MQFEKPTRARIAFSILSIALFIGAFHFFQESLSRKKGGIELVGGENEEERWIWVESPAFQRHAFGSGLTLGLVAFIIANGVWIKRSDNDPH